MKEVKTYFDGINLAKAYDRIKDFEPNQLERYIYITAKNAAFQILKKEKNETKNISLDDIENTISTEDLEKTDPSILDKYVDGDRNNVLVEGFIFNKMKELDKKIELEKTKMLHLCAEVRMYLWT